MTACDKDAIEELSKHISEIRTDVQLMIDARKEANQIESEREKAIAYHDNVIPKMETIRYHIDKLELMVDNEMWPLPKYREMLFIR
jgi:glutamine synthetase